MIIAVLVGLSPIASGLLVMNMKLNTQLENDARNAAIEGLGRLEAAISPIAAANEALLSIAGKPCATALPALREKVIELESLRSLLLVSDNTIYCSSLLGDADIPLSPGSFFNRTLWLRAGNEITPDRAVLYYRTYEHPYGVVSLIDGNTLRNKLAPNKADVTLTLEVGRSFLKNEGLVGSSEGPGHEEFHSREVSAQFGFAVHGGFPAGTHWQQFKARATMTTGSLLLVGLLTGGIVHWSMVRYRREDLPA